MVNNKITIKPGLYFPYKNSHNFRNFQSKCYCSKSNGCKNQFIREGYTESAFVNKQVNFKCHSILKYRILHNLFIG